MATLDVKVAISLGGSRMNVVVDMTGEMMVNLSSAATHARVGKKRYGLDMV